MFELLPRHGLTLATAESCTGGLVAQRITSVAGSSTYYVGGVVAYSNELKMSLLGVPPELLERHGAVSRQCALAMAAGIRERTGAAIGVATTGIAGPGGATATKPVGLVYVACATPWGEDARECRLPGDRWSNTRASADVALDLVLARAREGLAGRAG
ncbi:MAG TPA: nicotinamide-nucleotide amidohydrolase family protein [Thermomicrobiaceae bacterium]|nr:nicotinamide-nucleotide amidohydrolase family protein [Thermomicrobiaceae bacterium]